MVVRSKSNNLHHVVFATNIQAQTLQIASVEGSLFRRPTYKAHGEDVRRRSMERWWSYKI